MLMGLKLLGLEALDCLGMGARVVWLIVFGGVSLEKRLLMKVVTSFPMAFPVFLKNSPFNPSGPGLLQLLRLRRMVMISSLVSGGIVLF